MARWDDVLCRAGAESIHANIVDQTWEAYKAQTAAAKIAPSHEQQAAQESNIYQK